MKMNCILADICLPCYWSGHHLPHVQVPVWNGRSLKDIREDIKNELRMGAVGGSSDNARLLSSYFVSPDEEKRANALTRAAYAAIKRDVVGARKRQKVIRDESLPGPNDEGYTVYAFFVFREATA